MSTSAYAALYLTTTDDEPKILFLQRSNGGWWLPGGRISAGERDQQIKHLVSNLVTHYDEWHPNGIGLWHLSPEGGSGKVHLFESHATRPSRIRIKNPDSGLTKSLAWFDRRNIREHLYQKKDMPWGQAKMAIYSLHNLWVGKRRAIDDPLKDDLGTVADMVWNRPN